MSNNSSQSGLCRDCKIILYVHCVYSSTWSVAGTSSLNLPPRHSWLVFSLEHCYQVQCLTGEILKQEIHTCPVIVVLLDKPGLSICSVYFFHHLFNELKDRLYNYSDAAKLVEMF